MVAWPFARDNAKRLMLKVKKTKKKGSTKKPGVASTPVVVDPKRPWRTAAAVADDDSTSSSSSESPSSDGEDSMDEQESIVVNEQDVKNNKSSSTSKPPLNAVAVAADPEKISISACRDQYENGEKSGWDGRTIPDTQEEWEMLARGPLFLPFTPEIAGRPIYQYVVQPFLRLRDIFALSTGGAASKNRSIDAMNSTRFARFARKFGICSAGQKNSSMKSMNEIDLMFIRHTKDKGISALRFSDFVWLLLVELGSALLPNSAAVASHEKLKAIVDYLNANETNLCA